ncbi:unnamed protein product [Lactuca virosa]|uniref:Integrase catalytic domain-containing protein n=1 Tax=Lactuca virosa TaxID=75947 RepID=A0AAU9NFD4_9ASTR|nr:unnamed protein product [Lactuca virosa]
MGKSNPTMQGLRRGKNVEHGKINLIMGNRKASPFTKIGFYSLLLSTVSVVDNLGNNVLCIDSSSNNNLDKASLWHCRLRHVSKKRIRQLQKDGVLESFDLKSDDSHESCLLGKMTKSPFTGSCARGEGLLDLVHTNVNIKMLRSDRGGEYLSTEFLDYLKECGIISQLTPPRTPQLNGVAERRNRTLLDMVRSMMSRASLPISF